MTVKISWNAPVVPGKSLAGIPLDINSDALVEALEHYRLKSASDIYQFESSPLLKRIETSLNDFVDEAYVFVLLDDSRIHKFNKGTYALGVALNNQKILEITAYNFSFPGDEVEGLVYRGRLPGGAKLGSKVSDLLAHTDLIFDDDEERFYTTEPYGLLRIDGQGVPLDHVANQYISAITLLQG